MRDVINKKKKRREIIFDLNFTYKFVKISYSTYLNFGIKIQLAPTDCITFLVAKHAQIESALSAFWSMMIELMLKCMFMFMFNN